MRPQPRLHRPPCWYRPRRRMEYPLRCRMWGTRRPTGGYWRRRLRRRRCRCHPHRQRNCLVSSCRIRRRRLRRRDHQRSGPGLVEQPRVAATAAGRQGRSLRRPRRRHLGCRPPRRRRRRSRCRRAADDHGERLALVGGHRHGRVFHRGAQPAHAARTAAGAVAPSGADGRDVYDGQPGRYLERVRSGAGVGARDRRPRRRASGAAWAAGPVATVAAAAEPSSSASTPAGAAQRLPGRAA